MTSLRDLAEALKLRQAHFWDGNDYSAGIDALVNEIESSPTDPLRTQIAMELEVEAACRPYWRDPLTHAARLIRDGG